jgi:hypothetical protein
MTHDSGNLSIDFLVGFTIFIITFIWVATMIPGILINLHSNSLDFDAVAYRTGVILVEDPGMPSSPPWEQLNTLQKTNITRFGLDISKDTPNILSQAKVMRFFCTTAFTYPDDYHTRAIFGDYPYHFNISMRDDENNMTLYVGETRPDNYGYIRRLVKIKGYSNASIGSDYINAHHYFYHDLLSDNTTTHVFSILINSSELREGVRDPLYRIDPDTEPLTINITDIRSTIWGDANPATMGINITSIDVYNQESTPMGLILSKKRNFNTPYIDGNSSSTAPPVPVVDNVSLIIDPQFFQTLKGEYTNVYVNLTFQLTRPSTFLNNSLSDPFDYNYNPANVTQARFRDGIVEVAVW